MNGTGKQQDISAEAVPPESSITRRSRILMEAAAKQRGHTYIPPRERLTPLQQDLARIENCPDHTVYLLYAAGRIKIGYTTGDVRRREEAIANGSPVHVWLVKTIAGGKITEFKLHHQFKDARVYGEWFCLTPELRSFILDGNPNCCWALPAAETQYREWLKAELKRTGEI